jgi:hypothetical protein
MLSHLGLNKMFWGEALSYACHIVNRLPSVTLNRRTPLEVWSGSPANDYDSMHIFGCSTYYHVTESKLDPKAMKAIFLGFSRGVKGYRLWCPESKKVILSRDVTFDESGMLQQEKSQEKEKQSGDAQQMEFETSTIPIKDYSGNPY